MTKIPHEKRHECRHTWFPHRDGWIDCADHDALIEDFAEWKAIIEEKASHAPRPCDHEWVTQHEIRDSRLNPYQICAKCRTLEIPAPD